MIIKRYYQFIKEEAIPYSKIKPLLEIERSELVNKKLNEIFDKLSNLEGATTSKRGDRVYIPSDIKEVELEI